MTMWLEEKVEGLRTCGEEFEQKSELFKDILYFTDAMCENQLSSSGVSLTPEVIDNYHEIRDALGRFPGVLDQIKELIYKEIEEISKSEGGWYSSLPPDMREIKW